jgi:citrate synthase
LPRPARPRLRPWHERDPEAAAAEVLHLTAIIPDASRRAGAIRSQRHADPPDPALGHVENYLWMLHGRRPTPAQVVVASRYMILTADHSMNASTFTARVVASTGADVGARARPRRSARSRGRCTAARRRWCSTCSTRSAAPIAPRDGSPTRSVAGRRLMGFGHRVYRAEDPARRVPCARPRTRSAPSASSSRATVEMEALAALRAAKPGRALFTNVEYWSAVALDAAGIPRELFTPTFAAARADRMERATSSSRCATIGSSAPTSTTSGPAERPVS